MGLSFGQARRTPSLASNPSLQKDGGWQLWWREGTEAGKEAGSGLLDTYSLGLKMSHRATPSSCILPSQLISVGVGKWALSTTVLRWALQVGYLQAGPGTPACFQNPEFGRVNSGIHSHW